MHDPNERMLREAWIFCMILGLVMLNFPFIQIFNNTQPIFGIPAIVIYLFFGWFVSILVIYLFIRRSSRSKKDDGSES